MLEFTLTAGQAKRLGTLFETIDAKSNKAIASFERVFCSLDGAGNLVALVTDRFAIVELRFTELDSTGSGRFDLSPAQAKLLKSAKLPAKIEQGYGATKVTIGDVTLAYDHALGAEFDKLREFLDGSSDSPAVAEPVKMLLERIASLSKLTGDWQMTTTGTGKPVKFVAQDARALIQSMRGL